MTLESSIENYLVKRAKEEWLFLRKVCWIGRRYAPDRLLNSLHRAKTTRRKAMCWSVTRTRTNEKSGKPCRSYR